MNTAVENVKLMQQLADVGSVADLAHQLAKGDEDAVDSWKQRIHRAIQNGVEIPDDPERIEALLEALDAAVSAHIVPPKDE